MRDRSEGWQYAKLSGHKNEELIEKRLNEDRQFRKQLARRIGLKVISNLKIGGLCEESVRSILGDKTKSKTDLIVEGCLKTVNISIKKSKGGQVYLIGVDRFVKAMEHHYGKMPEKVVRSLRLLFSEAKEISSILRSNNITGNQSCQLKNYQLRKNRLVWETLKTYDNTLATVTLDWFRRNIGNITELCFSKGLANNKNDWAKFVWYENLLDDEDDEMNMIIPINEIVKKSIRLSKEEVYIGTRMGGSTIQLPYGFLQWHQYKMQFHHKLDKIFS